MKTEKSFKITKGTTGKRISEKDQPFRGFNWHKQPIGLDGNFVELLPIEIHFREDGAIDDKPSLAFTLLDMDTNLKIIGQVSLRMFNDGAKEFGYALKPIRTYKKRKK